MVRCWCAEMARDNYNDAIKAAYDEQLFKQWQNALHPGPSYAEGDMMPPQTPFEAFNRRNAPPTPIPNNNVGAAIVGTPIPNNMPGPVLPGDESQTTETQRKQMSPMLDLLQRMGITQPGIDT